MSYRRKEKTDEPLPLPNGFERDKHIPKTRIKSHMNSLRDITSELGHVHWKVIAGVAICWLMVVNYFERTSPKIAFEKCQWDRWENWEGKSRTISTPHRIALIGDPQIVDANTYTDQPKIVNYFIRKISDNYLHRNHVFLHSRLDPDTVIFLGDLFDGGREWNDDTWLEEFNRFNKVFPKKVNRNTIQSLPGNHDIGFQKIDPDVSKRFNAFFGEPSDYHELGNHSIVLLDTISLSHPDTKIKSHPMEFLNTLNDKLNPQFPRILLTHVPFYRANEKQLCGPLRESPKKFPVQKGKQYQTIINHDISQQIMSTVRPEIIFSGDDHDYCDIQHTYYDNGHESLAREITVKSASMTNGIKYPAIQLLSLNNPYDPKPKTKSVDEDQIDHEEKVNHTYSTHMCYLPSPYLALKVYVLSLLLTLGFLFVYFILPNSMNAFISRFSKVVLKKDSVLPSYDHTKWTPAQVGTKLTLLSPKRDIKGFFVHGGVVLVVLYLIFGIYYRYI